jgi:hypothetical protein
VEFFAIRRHRRARASLSSPYALNSACAAIARGASKSARDPRLLRGLEPCD